MPRKKGTTPEEIAAYKATIREENRRWYAAHKETINERHRSNYHADPDKHNDRAKKRRRARAEENPRPLPVTPEQRKERDRKRYAADRERRLKMVATYRAANPDKVKAYEHRRRARRIQAPGANFTPSEFRSLCDHYGNMCAYCGAPSPLVVEHIIPLVAGGSNEISNIAPACATCNGRKGSNSLGSFLRLERRSGRTPNIVTCAQFWQRRMAL